MAFGKREEQTKKKKGPRLPVGKFFAWKGSDVSIAGLNVIVNTYLAIYCTDFLGLSGTTVGAILFVSNVIDAVTDLIACYAVDNTHTRWGRGRPYELGIIGIWACSLLMFSCPGSWGQGVKIAWVFCMYTFAFGVFATFRGAASTTYAIRAFDNDRALIGKVYSYGGVVTTAGAMVVTITFPRMMGRLATSTAGWRPLIALYAVPLLLIGLLRFIFVKENPAVDAGHLTEKVHIKDIFRMLVTNKYVWFYGLVTLLFNAIQNISVMAHYFKYIVGDTDIMGVLGALSVVLLPVMFIFPRLMKKWSAAQIMMGGAVIAIAGYAVNFIAGSSIGLLFLGGILTTAATLPISYLGAVIIMDLCTYNEYKGLPRLDASTTVVSNNFMSQLGQGIGGALMGVLLDASGYISSEGSDAVTQPDSALAMIRGLYSWVPMILMALLIIAAYFLSRLSKRMPEIEQDLAKRETPVQVGGTN